MGAARWVMNVWARVVRMLCNCRSSPRLTIPREARACAQVLAEAGARPAIRVLATRIPLVMKRYRDGKVDPDIENKPFQKENALPTSPGHMRGATLH
ncbi:MAG: hypothetical protein NVS2B16_10590 [Chloroflexota bacterium]